MIETNNQEGSKKSTKNTGKLYEILTQKIFQELSNQSYVKNIDVKHNVILVGQSSKHQIDVFWEFEVSGVSYKTVVQTKDWTDNVKQEQLFAFKAVLDDIPGQPRGVFVTRTGYQQGALEYAQKHGIDVYVLREPQNQDYENQISSLIISSHISKTDVKIIAIKPDVDWMKNELLRYQVPRENYPSNIKITNYEMLYDENGLELGTIYNIFTQSDQSTIENSVVTKKFNNAYIKTPSEFTNRTKILEITCKIFKQTTDDEFTFDLDSMVKHILKNVLTKEVKNFPI